MNVNCCDCAGPFYPLFTPCKHHPCLGATVGDMYNKPVQLRLLWLRIQKSDGKPYFVP